MNKFSVSLVCVTSMLFSASSLAAGQVQGDLGVQLVISDGCEISGGVTTPTGNSFGTLDFGTHGGSIINTLRAQSAANSGGLEINCTNALPYTIAIDDGTNADSLSTQRRLTDGSGNYINYNLYQDSTYSALWASATPRSFVGTGGDTSLIFYGAIPGGQSAAAGSYTDTVTVTVAW